MRKGGGRRGLQTTPHLRFRSRLNSTRVRSARGIFEKCARALRRTEACGTHAGIWTRLSWNMWCAAARDDCVINIRKRDRDSWCRQYEIVACFGHAFKCAPYPRRRHVAAADGGSTGAPPWRTNQHAPFARGYVLRMRRAGTALWPAQLHYPLFMLAVDQQSGRGPTLPRRARRYQRSLCLRVRLRPVAPLLRPLYRCHSTPKSRSLASSHPHPPDVPLAASCNAYSHPTRRAFASHQRRSSRNTGQRSRRDSQMPV